MTEIIENKSGSYHIPKWKIDEIKNIVDLIKSHKSVGILSFDGILGNQFQKMRRDLHNIATIKVSRNTLIEKALLDDSIDKKISNLKNYISTQTALIFTDINPFKLYSILEKTKTPSPIKAGSVSPTDIFIEKGPTSFPPGPILGEFQSAGIPVGVESGKIVIKESKVVCKSGEKVSQKLATALNKLEIYPLEVGLILQAVYDSGNLFNGNDLNIDTLEYQNNFLKCYKCGVNLSIDICYPTIDTIGLILLNTHNNALNLGINCSIYTKDTVNNIISNCFNEMILLSSLLIKKNDMIASDTLKEVISGVFNTKLLSSEKNEVNEHNKSDLKEEENQNNTEEDGMAGLGALFG